MIFLDRIKSGRAIDPTQVQGMKKKFISLAESKKENVSKIASKEEKSEEKKEKNLTVMFYLNGNNGMQGIAFSALRQAEFVGSSDGVNIVAQVSRNKKWYDLFTRDWSGARRYYVTRNDEPITPVKSIKEFIHWKIPPFTKGIKSKPVEDLGKVDMGNPDTLRDFMISTMKKFPAKRYMLVMLGPSKGFAGMMHDEKSGNSISPSQLKKAFGETREATGKAVDVVAIDSSAGSMMEIASEIKDEAKVLIGSEEIMSGMGAPLPAILYELSAANKNKALDPISIARYYAMITSMHPASAMFSPTVSGIDLSRMVDVTKALDNLGKAIAVANIPKEKIRELIKETQAYGVNTKERLYKSFKDAYHFAELLKNDPEIKSKTVKKAAENLMEAIDPVDPFYCGAVIAEAHLGKKYDNSHGIAIYMPDNFGFYRPESLSELKGHDRKLNYDQLALARDTSWDEFLESVAKDTKWNEFLKKVGFSEEVIDDIYAVKGSLAGPIDFAGNWAENIGSYEAWHAWRSKEARQFFFIGAALATKIGAAGGIYGAFKNAAKIYKGVAEGDRDAVVNSSLDTATSAAIAAANFGLFMAAYAGITTPAGIIAFALPLTKTAYGIYRQYQESKKNQQMADATRKQKLTEAVIQYFGRKLKWDGGKLGNLANKTVKDLF